MVEINQLRRKAHIHHPDAFRDNLKERYLLKSVLNLQVTRIKIFVEHWYLGLVDLERCLDESTLSRFLWANKNARKVLRIFRRKRTKNSPTHRKRSECVVTLNKFPAPSIPHKKNRPGKYPCMGHIINICTADAYATGHLHHKPWYPKRPRAQVCYFRRVIVAESNCGTTIPVMSHTAQMFTN